VPFIGSVLGTAVAVAAVIMAPQVVTSGSAPSPDPSLPRIPAASGATLPPPCRAAQLQTVASPPRGAVGTWRLDVRVRLVSGARCVLEGYPEIQAFGDGRSLEVQSAPDHGEGVFRGPVVLTRDNAAGLSLSWSGLWCTEHVRNSRLRATLADGAGTLTFAGFGSTPGCDGADGAGPLPISVRPFAPAD
jgi:hypothetical protein